MEIIDLSQIINEFTPVYPGDRRVSVSVDKTVETDGYCTCFLQSGLHAGTHIDSPGHMSGEFGLTAALPLSDFFGNGVLLDVRGEETVGYKPEYMKLVSRGDIVIIFTGFSEKYSEPGYFSAHPVVTRELADFFVSKKIKLLGMDMPSPDKFPFPVHKILLKNGICILENLTNLQKLIKIKAFNIYAFPLKLQAEASPVRAVCVTRRTRSD